MSRREEPASICQRALGLSTFCPRQGVNNLIFTCGWEGGDLCAACQVSFVFLSRIELSFQLILFSTRKGCQKSSKICNVGLQREER